MASICTDHSDGSVLFRFGNPKLEKLKTAHVQVDDVDPVEEEKLKKVHQVEEELKETAVVEESVKTHQSSENNVNVQVMEAHTGSTTTHHTMDQSLLMPVIVSLIIALLMCLFISLFISLPVSFSSPV